jgi:hypothetical protein
MYRGLLPFSTRMHECHWHSKNTVFWSKTDAAIAFFYFFVERTSLKEEILVSVFISTVGLLLVYAAVKPYVDGWWKVNKTIISSNKYV